MARHPGLVVSSSKVVLIAALAVWLLLATPVNPTIAQQACGPICRLDATYFVVSGVRDDLAYVGGDGISCCGELVPDAQFGSLNPGVTWVSLYNPEGRFQMNLVAASGSFGGNLDVRGVKRFIQAYPTDPTKQIAYVSLEGPEAGTYIRGTAELVNGMTVVSFPDHFSMVTSDKGLTVQLTPVGDWLQLYVVEKSTTKLVIKEEQGKSGQFDYLVQGMRKGYENYQVIQDKRR